LGEQADPDWFPPLEHALREHLNSSGYNTMRGSGDHHSIGCCAEYQGNTPRS
jgi:hypothetical protein